MDFLVNFEIFKFFHFLNCTKTILLWQIPNFLSKSSCMGALVLKTRIKCFAETLRLYALLRIPSKCNTCKATFATWLPVGKHLEFPEPKYLHIKNMKKLK
jgi:hypothetical protein